MRFWGHCEESIGSPKFSTTATHECPGTSQSPFAWPVLTLLDSQNESPWKEMGSSSSIIFGEARGASSL